MLLLLRNHYLAKFEKLLKLIAFLRYLATTRHLLHNETRIIAE